MSPQLFVLQAPPKQAFDSMPHTTPLSFEAPALHALLAILPAPWQVELKVNKMASIHTQVPYDYYALKFCKPRGGVTQVRPVSGAF